MRSIAQFIVIRWWVVIAFACVISGVALFGLISPAGGVGMNEAKTAYRLKEMLDGEFGSDGSECVVLVDVADGNLFTKSRLKALKGLVKEIESTQMVEEVMWLDDIKVPGKGLLPKSLIPSGWGVDEEAIEEALEVAKNHPLASQLLSGDAASTIMPVMYTKQAMEAGHYREKFLTVRNAIESVDLPDGLRVRLTGLFPMWAAEQDAVKRDRVKFIIIGYVLAAGLAIYLFRSVLVAAAIGIPAFIGVFWSLGTISFLVDNPTPLTQVVMPMMLTMVGFTDAVHLMFHIRRARCEGETRREAAISAVRLLGAPCALTSFTTAIGFGSLMVAEAEVIRSFGMSCAIGVVLTFIAVVSLVPLLSLTRLGAKVHLSEEKDMMVRNRDRAGAFVNFLMRNAKWVVAGAAVLMVVFGSSASRLRPDNRFLERMPDRSEAYLAMRHVDEQLGGTQVLRVSLHWDDGILDHAALVDKLIEVEAVLRGEKLLSEPLSLLGLLRSLPGDSEDLAARMRRLGFIPDKVVRGVYREDSRRAVVAVRVQDLGIAKYKPVFERVEKALEQLEIPGLQIEMTGDPLIWGRYLDRMVMDLLRSLALASAVILIVMGLVYRSLRTGLIAIVPNLFPIAATGAMLSFLGIPLVIETVCAFTICLGIAVDDTIHFLSRHRIEVGRGDQDTAIRESFIKVGSPLLVTTVLMVSAFATSLWSELPGFRIFGAMACATLAAAFVADLVILPALLKIFGKSTSARSQPSSP